jgi:hypothetical protein
MPAGSRSVSGRPLTATLIVPGPDGRDGRLHGHPIFVTHDLERLLGQRAARDRPVALTIAPAAGAVAARIAGRRHPEHARGS